MQLVGLQEEKQKLLRSKAEVVNEIKRDEERVAKMSNDCRILREKNEGLRQALKAGTEMQQTEGQPPDEQPPAGQ